MHIGLWVDMEGAGGIDDYRACLPAFPHYWETGRAALTADVIAAAEGLLAGGATSVSVVDIHGPGWFKNLISDRLPVGVEPFSGPLHQEVLDAAFHIGFHARCGTADGFMSHTHVPEFRIKVNDALVTENHVLAWNAAVPVLGVAGDRALEPELDGMLAGTPFLEVKRSTSRTATTLRYPDPDERAAAIRDFARQCLQSGRERPAPIFAPGSQVLISMNPQLIDATFEEHGLHRRSRATLSMIGSEWRTDIWPRVRIAARAASRPLDEPVDQLDLTNPAVVRDGNPHALQQLRERFDAWMHMLHPAWEE